MPIRFSINAKLVCCYCSTTVESKADVVEDDDDDSLLRVVHVEEPSGWYLKYGRVICPACKTK